MEYLIYLYLLLFPFGQLLKFKFINLSDVIVLVIAMLFVVLRGKRILNIAPPVRDFLGILCFSIVFSLSFFEVKDVVVGCLYLVRLISYIVFAAAIKERFFKKKEFIGNCLIFGGVAIGVLGFLQYIFLPDLRGLQSLGWDDHYFRLVSTFLDPAFTGIILVLTTILTCIRYFKEKTKTLFFVNVFLVVAIACTFSRSSYGTLVFVFVFLWWKFRKKIIFLLLGIFGITVLLLPKPYGEGVNLARTYSINAKYVNSQESGLLFTKSPLFGIGFDNVCLAKEKFLGKTDVYSHACSGLDNSFLFITVTTGSVGFLAFLRCVYFVVKNTKRDTYGWVFLISLMAICMHGFFTNTLFYSFILGWMGFLWAISRVND